MVSKIPGLEFPFEVSPGAAGEGSGGSAVRVPESGAAAALCAGTWAEVSAGQWANAAGPAVGGRENEIMLS